MECRCRWFSIAAGCLLAAGCATPEREAREDLAFHVAALPLRNLTADPDVPREIAWLLREALQLRGATFVADEDIEAILRERRIRHVDTLSRDAVRAIARETGAARILLGKVLDWDAASPPRLTLSLRLLDGASGVRMASTVVSLHGDEFRGLLGLGALEDPRELQAEVVVRAMDALSAQIAAAAGAARERNDSPPRRTGAVLQAFRCAGFSPAEVERVLILPFGNESGETLATEVFADLVADAWFQEGGVRAVEHADLLAALVEERVRSIDGLDLAVLARVAGRLETRWIVTGTIHRYQDGIPYGRALVPRIELSIQIFDATEQRLVASSVLDRQGDDFHVALGLGTIRQPIVLATRMAREILGAL